jgi:prepilin-type N-terminal cleavage/methylation domain-containing protein
MLKRGFTLIELLIVIAIIAILAMVAFVSINSLMRFQDSRDSVRWQVANDILTAIKLDQVDNGGHYLPAIASLANGIVYMIGTDTSGCTGFNTHCTTAVSNDTACVNLSELATRGYLGKVPISPNGAGNWTSGHTGYTLTVTGSGVTVRACENEHSNEIELTR